MLRAGLYPRFVKKIIMETNQSFQFLSGFLQYWKVMLYSLPLTVCLYEPLVAQDVEQTRLDSLTGYTQTIYFSPGNKERADGIAKFMDGAGDYFQQHLQFKPRVRMFVLAPQHWKQYATFPVYGMPHNIDHIRLAIAANDNPFWQSFLPPLDQLPAPLAERIKLAYGKTDGSYSMQPFFDLLALHEMGHSYHAQAGLKMHRKWMGELFVNIMLHTYIAEKQPELLPALETFPEMVVGAGSAAYKYTSLADFEAIYDDAGKGMTAKNYGWYQSHLHHAAKMIYNAGGPEVIQQLWKALKTHQQPTADEAFATMLQREVHTAVANVYLKWNQPGQWNN